MKKVLITMTILILTMVLLGACSDSTEDEETPVNEETTADEDTTGDNKEETDTAAENNNKEDQVDEDEETEVKDQGSTNGGFTTGTEDQLDLSIGDTGRFDSDLTTYEITLENAELVDEIDGTASQLDAFLIVELTIKNTGEDTQSTDDLLYGLEVTDNLDMSGYQVYGYNFDGSNDSIKMELAPGKETSGKFYAETYTGDTYYFLLRTGIAGSGSSNQVTWVIPSEEVNQ
ncbi:DUF4352 domain-containing protein [Oceanobacillus damuensis]|uniref:DUF4352 domain-containing protein n=1 Tax=Oceanobacillus damuensis TaxID=937928 RepID=UPI00082D7CE3|nr:DUF4352 domain-containing protein [Oceanobacillus damuensis]